MLVYFIRAQGTYVNKRVKREHLNIYFERRFKTRTLTDLNDLFSFLFSDAQDTPSEGIISRDINRTFPAHDYFKEAGGVGQDSLYKISKVRL